MERPKEPVGSLMRDPRIRIRGPGASQRVEDLKEEELVEGEASATGLGRREGRRPVKPRERLGELREPQVRKYL